MADKLFGLTTQQMDWVRETVMHYVRLYGGGQRGTKKNQDQRKRRAVLNEDITAPTSSLATMTTADMYFLEMQSDGTSDVLDAGPYDANNNDPEFTAVRGTLILVEWVDGRWLITGASCNPQDALITALDAL